MSDKVDEVSEKSAAVADYWFSGQLLFCIVLALVGAAVIFAAMRLSLPYLDSGAATAFDMPGLGPIVVGAGLIALCLALAAKCVRAGGRLAYFASPEFRRALVGGEARIVYIVFGSLAVYVFMLFPYLPYALASFIFLVGTMALLKLFTWRSVLASALYSAALWFVFAYLFSINLPH